MVNRINKIIQRNCVTTFGNGTQPLLFAPGFGVSQDSWRFITPAFEKNYKVVLFDYVGSGKSDPSEYKKERYSTLNGYAQDIIEICEALNLNDVIFVGHSISSMIGLLASLKKPNCFAKMILIVPSPCYINDKDYLGGADKKDIFTLVKSMEENYADWASSLTTTALNNPDRPDINNELFKSFLSLDQEIAKQFVIATFFCDLRKDLSKFRKSTLIMQCTDDVIVPLHIGEYLNKNLTNSTLKVLKARGHFPQLTDPDETIKVIKDYLSQHELSSV